MTILFYLSNVSLHLLMKGINFNNQSTEYYSSDTLFSAPAAPPWKVNVITPIKFIEFLFNIFKYGYSFLNWILVIRGILIKIVVFQMKLK